MDVKPPLCEQENIPLFLTGKTTQMFSGTTYQSGSNSFFGLGLSRT
ncbi:hypothetical protein SAMN04487895_11970 [Paenibacillus sophorae]|uniref:Uncharacterized protein n=1 Tax=Paenibacillus sophorae TaxID=1333845 RepID=A0A1H8UWS9_9BACL|nr:hypothetical protein [Paenibacillus sophorae]QWU15336.1 hypothetical protein KP014_26225 [Paenibacillus sophorae]SEP07404.1 hypothetical protein SAMN04487895_11970 [Paenibacillus sophorae]